MEKSHYLDDIALKERNIKQNQHLEYKIFNIATFPNTNSTLTLISTISAQNIVYFSNIMGIEAAAASQYTFQI